MKAANCLAFAFSVFASAVSAGADFVGVAPKEVPVIAEVDVAVVGGNEGGMAAAWALAKAGRTVIWLNEWTAIQGDTVAKNKFNPDAPLRGSFAPAVFGGLDKNNFGRKFPLAVDRAFADVGVRCIFNTRHVGILRSKNGGIGGVLTANKSGVQAVAAKAVIDATEFGAVAADAGCRRVPRGAEDFSWRGFCRDEWKSRVKRHRNASPPFRYIRDFALPYRFDGFDGFVCRGEKGLYAINASVWPRTDGSAATIEPSELAYRGELLGGAIDAALGKIAAPDVAELSGGQGADVKNGGYPVVREIDAFCRERKGLVRVAGRTVPVAGEYDVVVVGSGCSGLAAAVAASRAGAKVLVAEQCAFPGGAPAFGIPGFWRGYRRGFNQEWLGKADRSPEYLKLLDESGAEVWLYSMAIGAVMSSNRVVGVEFATPCGPVAALARIVVDASGDGDVCVAAGAKSLYLDDGDMCIEESSYLSGWVGSGTDKLDLNVVPVDATDADGATRQHRLAVRHLGGQTYPYVQLRQTRQILCDIVLDVPGLDAGMTYPDVIGVASSAYDAHGFFSSDWSYAGLLPFTKRVKKDTVAYIPLRATVPAGLEGIYVTGRALSAVHDVQALLRMNADMLNLGYATGYAAALCAKDGTTARGVDVKALQDHLFAIGNLPLEDRDAIVRPFVPPSDSEIAAAAADPSARANLLALALAGSRAVAPLEEEFARSGNLAKAKALAMLGSRAGNGLLAGWLAKAPLPPPKAYAWDGFLSIPEFDSVAWTAASTRDPAVAEVLARRLDECDAGTAFLTLRTLTVSIGRIGSKDSAPALERFLAKSGVRGHADPGEKTSSLKAKDFAPAMIELFAARALVECGDPHGTGREILRSYRDDCRGLFVRFAAAAGREP